MAEDNIRYISTNTHICAAENVLIEDEIIVKKTEDDFEAEVYHEIKAIEFLRNAGKCRATFSSKLPFEHPNYLCKTLEDVRRKYNVTSKQARVMFKTLPNGKYLQMLQDDEDDDVEKSFFINAKISPNILCSGRILSAKQEQIRQYQLEAIAQSRIIGVESVAKKRRDINIERAKEGHTFLYNVKPVCDPFDNINIDNLLENVDVE